MPSRDYAMHKKESTVIATMSPKRIYDPGTEDRCWRGSNRGGGWCGKKEGTELGGQHQGRGASGKQARWQDSSTRKSSVASTPEA